MNWTTYLVNQRTNHSEKAIIMNNNHNLNQYTLDSKKRIYWNYKSIMNKKSNCQQNETLSNYIKWLNSRNISPKTIQTYTKGIRHYGQINLTTENISDFFKRIREKLDATTLISRKTALKSYAKFQQLKVEWERIAKVIPKVQKKFFTTINEEELELKQ